MSVKLEYLYANFGSTKLRTSGKLWCQTVETPDFQALRLGLNWKFQG